MGVSPLKDTGKLITNPKEQAQLFNNQFLSVFSPRDTVTAEEFQIRCPPKPDLPEYTDCKNINITDERLKKLLLNLDPNKACGPDGITPGLLKIVAEEVTPALTFLFETPTRLEHCHRTGN